MVVEGTPETVAACPASHTGRYPARLLDARAGASGGADDPVAPAVLGLAQRRAGPLQQGPR